MSNQPVTFKPSFLVAARITRAGGVTYARQDLEAVTEGNQERTRWEATRHVANVDEVARAERAASECRRRLSAVCVRTAFGLLCARDLSDQFEGTMAEIRRTAAAVNAELTACRLEVHVIRGEIASNDGEAARALGDEVTRFFSELRDAVAACDAKAIRAVLLRAKGLDSLLQPTQAAAFTGVVRTARAMARRIVAEVETKGRQIELVAQELDLSPIDQARLAFVELEAGEELGGVDLVEERTWSLEDVVAEVVA